MTKPTRAEHQADEAEEVHRLARVAGQEHHAEQVEEAAEDALEAVARLAVLAGVVLDRHLGDAKALPRGEGGDEAEEVAVDRDACGCTSRR